MNKMIIEEIEKKQMKKNLPTYRPGDTVRVSKVIVEGKKERIQKYEGVIIQTKGERSRQSITVRKIVDKIGVEKSFLIHSELVPKIEILQQGKVRRAKLFYLRDRIGIKARRIKAKK